MENKGKLIRDTYTNTETNLEIQHTLTKGSKLNTTEQ